MPITAGSISIGRRINTGDYSHKEAKVELHYVVEGGEKIGDLGDTARVEALTQLSAILSTVVTIEHTPEIVVDGGVAATIETPEQKTKRHRRTKAEMEAARAAEQEAPPADPTPGASTPAPSTSSADQPGVPVDPTLAADASTPSFAPDVSAATATGNVEISDKELNIACNEMANRLHAVNKDKEENTRRIKGLIAQFTNGNSATIPQDQRARFLGLLKAL